jgi:hypothetical protein
MGCKRMRRSFVSASMFGLAVLAPVWVTPGGASSADVVDHPCRLVTATEASEVLDGSVHQLGVRGPASCLYVLQNSTGNAAPGVSPSIQIVTSTEERSVRTVKTLLNPRRLKVIQRVAKGAVKFNFTRHFVSINGRRTVYTIQGDPAVVLSKSGELLPQANISTIVHNSTVEILVTGVTQPQKVAEAIMGDALSRI